MHNLPTLELVKNSLRDATNLGLSAYRVKTVIYRNSPVFEFLSVGKSARRFPTNFRTQLVIILSFVSANNDVWSDFESRTDSTVVTKNNNNIIIVSTRSTRINIFYIKPRGRKAPIILYPLSSEAYAYGRMRVPMSLQMFGGLGVSG